MRCLNGSVTTTLDRPAAATDATEPPRSRWFTRPSSDRVGFGVLLVATAVMYLWNITVNGMGNQFYAAAAQAGSKNWEALLFGSLDTQNFITVDKPPVSQWVMGLSGQIFGFSSASMLIPQALMAYQSGLTSYQSGGVDFETVFSSFLDVLNFDGEYWKTLMEHETALARIEQITGVPLN